MSYSLFKRLCVGYQDTIRSIVVKPKTLMYLQEKNLISKDSNV